ncbi:unnamed protein product, partial [Dovyalis caffra]
KVMWGYLFIRISVSKIRLREESQYVSSYNKESFGEPIYIFGVGRLQHIPLPYPHGKHFSIGANISD